ncbi:MAG: MFS transporter [Sulfurimonas sp.]
MNQYLALLKSENILRRLSTIQLISYFGAWFSNVAIYTLLIEMQATAEVVAFVAMLHFLSGVVQAPFSGAIIDKLQPKKLMLFLIAIEITATASLIFISGLHQLELLYILIFLNNF